MAAGNADIAGLVTSVVEPLIENKDEFEVSQTVSENGDVLVEIRVAEEDTGKVIGRQGRVIKAIRTLARAAAMCNGDFHVDVELID